MEISSFSEFFALLEGGGTPGYDIPAYLQVEFGRKAGSVKYSRIVEVPEISAKYKRWAVQRAAASILVRQGEIPSGTNINKLKDNCTLYVTDVSNVLLADIKKKGRVIPLHKAKSINESMIRVPKEVMDQVKRMFVEADRKRRSSPKKKIDNADFPPVIIKMDFSGTAYEHLNKLKPKLKVFFSGSGQNVFWEHDFYTGAETVKKKKVGNIMLNLKTSRDDMLNFIIEHELAHFIQAFLAVAHQTYKAGLMSQKFTPKHIDTEGYTKNKKKRVAHELRPVELPTNLISILRQLEKNFWSLLPNPYTHTEHNKNIYLAHELPNYSIMKMIKKAYPRAYQKYVKSIYKYFMSSDITKNSSDMNKEANKQVMRDSNQRVRFGR